MTDTAFAERWLWLTASLCITTVAIAIRWILERPHTAPTRVKLSLGDNAWLVQSLRLLYAVGIPAAALLLRGALTPSGLGLKPFFWVESDVADLVQTSWEIWVRDFGWGVASVAGMSLCVIAGDQMVKRYARRKVTLKRNPGIAVREAIYHQAHWAFYREPFVLLWGDGVGTWAGLVPVALEAIVNPARWNDLQSPGKGRDLLIRCGLAVTSAMLYMQTHNIWIALLADVAVVLVLGQNGVEDTDHHPVDGSVK